ncbi:hypothetical protein FRC12_004235 [Ceratobasidium sp. 428]|nr:hypothetical protein FRC12_004235 [Ceratobasidium sp. 428]
MLFGMSSTLFGLIACRSIVYALGPQLAWSTTVTVLGDLADNGNHGAAFSAVNASYRLGQLISESERACKPQSLTLRPGPIFAALFAHPAVRFSWFNSAVWKAHPYALPCFGGAALCFGGLFMIAYYLPETAPGLCRVDKLDEQLEDGYSSIAPPLTGIKSSEPTIATIQDETTPPQLLPAGLEPIAHLAAAPAPAKIFTSHIIQLLVSSWIMYFISISFSTLFPLWAFTPISSGGLGASENIIGVYISAL